MVKDIFSNISFKFLKCKYRSALFFVLSLNLLLVACSASDIGGSNNTGSNYSNSNQQPVAAVTTRNINNGNSSSNLNSSNGKHAGPASLYPNPNLTPGDVFPGVTAKEVCVSGYSKGVRNVTSEEKAAVYQRYGMQNIPGNDEVDHFISLELGGSNNLKNLWPEPYEPRPGAHEKDKVENALHAEVCSGNMTLEQAQNIIRTDWYAYYLKIEGNTTKN